MFLFLPAFFNKTQINPWLPHHCVENKKINVFILFPVHQRIEETAALLLRINS